MAPDSAVRRLIPLLCFGIGLCATAAALLLLIAHARIFSEKRDMALIIGTELPALRSRVALLEAGVEAQKIYGSEAAASREEQAQIFILPEEPDIARAVRSVQEITLAIKQGLTVESISFGKTPSGTGALKALPGTIVLKGDAAHMARFLRILDLAGTFTVRDALTAGTASKFLADIQEASPLSLKNAEQFLHTDLITYAAQPDTTEDRMLQEIQPSAAVDIRTFLLKSGLADIRAVLSDIAASLRDKRVWPVPLLLVQSVEQVGDKWTLHIEIVSR